MDIKSKYLQKNPKALEILSKGQPLFDRQESRKKVIQKSIFVALAIFIISIFYSIFILHSLVHAQVVISALGVLIILICIIDIVSVHQILINKEENKLLTKFNLITTNDVAPVDDFLIFYNTDYEKDETYVITDHDLQILVPNYKLKKEFRYAMQTELKSITREGSETKGIERHTPLVEQLLIDKELIPEPTPVDEFID